MIVELSRMLWMGKALLCLKENIGQPNAGYSNSNHLLTPYKGIPDHLKEQQLTQQAALKPQRYSSLRNGIEPIFGINKKRFPYLKIGMAFSKETQVGICVCSHSTTQLHCSPSF